MEDIWERKDLKQKIGVTIKNNLMRTYKRNPMKPTEKRNAVFENLETPLNTCR